MPTAPRRHRHPRRWRLGVFVVVALVGMAVVGPAQAGDPGTTKAPTVGIDPALAAILDQVDPADHIPVIAILREQIEPGSVRPPAGKRRDAAVVAELKGHAEKTQRGLRTMLGAGRLHGDVTAVEPLWIVNGVGLTARPATIRAIARRPEIAAIVPDRAIAAPPAAGAADSTAPVEPNIARIGAPALWDLGIRGEGVVIASMDTGVDPSHPDVAGRQRPGPGGWFDPYGQHASAADFSGHGTQTMGVMVGGEAGGTAIGVAPGATWIAARIFNDSGVGTSTAVHLAFQWVLDPDGDPATADAPFVVNESWAMGAPGCNLDFEPDLEALVAAGITPIFAAGNYGPTAGSAGSPGNNPGAFAVGAVDNADAILAQSSRGPTTCGRSTAMTYPAVTAPGVDIHSADLHGMYATSSGTSMSAPHVSGALALLHQAFPSATPAQLLASLRASAVDLGTAGLDDTFGAGRVDVMAAYTDLLGAAPTPTPTPIVTPEPTPTTTPTASPTPSPTPTPVLDVLGPLSGIPIVAPRTANGTGGVVISTTLDDTLSGGSAVAGGEWFVDAAGTPGSGHPLDGAFGTAQVTASGVISTGDIATLADGVHPIAVHGRDSAGNWGPISTTVLVVDRVGPTASNGRVTGTPTQGATSTMLTATIVDTASEVGAAEWFIGADPGPGAATALEPTDGAFDGSTETVQAAIPLAGRPNGETVVRYRGRDSTGTWGPVGVVTFTITPSDAIFADGFESGSTGRWTGRTGSNRLAVTPTAAMAGQFGMSVTVKSATRAYVSDSRPKAARVYHARFGFDPRRLVTFGKSVDVFTGIDRAGRVLFRLQYRRSSAAGTGQVRIAVRRAGGTSHTRWATLSAGRHAVELGWRSGRSSTVRLSLDGVVVASVSRLDTHAYALEAVRLGPSAGLTSSMRGELRFDRFVSTRGSTIGP